MSEKANLRSCSGFIMDIVPRTRGRLEGFDDDNKVPDDSVDRALRKAWKASLGWDPATLQNVTEDSIYIFWGPHLAYVGQADNFRRRMHEHYRVPGDNQYGIFSKDPFTKVAVFYGGELRGRKNAIEKELISLWRQDDYERPKGEKCPNTNVAPGNKDSDSNIKASRKLVVPEIWQFLSEEHLVFDPNVDGLRTGCMYLHSPFPEPTEEQLAIVSEVVSNRNTSFLVRGTAGTGKTILLNKLVQELCRSDEEEGVVSPEKDILVVMKGNNAKRNGEDLKRAGLNVDVVTPNLAAKRCDRTYRTIIVDEAHRLERMDAGHSHATTRKIMRATPFDDQLEMLKAMRGADGQLVIMYDPLQSVRSSDVPRHEFGDLLEERWSDGRKRFKELHLERQLRIRPGGDEHAQERAQDFVNGIAYFLGIGDVEASSFDPGIFSDDSSDDPYFGICDSIQALFDYTADESKDNPGSANRVLAGYYKDYLSKPKEQNKRHRKVCRADYDDEVFLTGNGTGFSSSDGSPVCYDWGEESEEWGSCKETGGLKRRWNESYRNWVYAYDPEKNKRHAQEIGCIHAAQGEDISFAGVIIGDDLVVRDGELHACGESFPDAGSLPNKPQRKTPPSHRGKTDAEYEEALANYDRDWAQYYQDLDGYVKDAYFTLLMRGVSGIRVYFTSPEVRRYFEQKVGITRV